VDIPDPPNLVLEKYKKDMVDVFLKGFEEASDRKDEVEVSR
jgi:hypothetical protein